jgi:hypothetical protein
MQAKVVKIFFMLFVSREWLAVEEHVRSCRKWPEVQSHLYGLWDITTRFHTLVES